MVRLFLWGLLVGSTEGVAAGPDEYSATPANNDEEADFFVRFFASLLYYTMYNIQFVEKRRKKQVRESSLFESILYHCTPLQRETVTDY